MRKIEKPINEPQVLTDFKNSCYDSTDNSYTNCNYNSFQNPQRNQYKEILLKEQGYLCAYCNKEIDLTTSSIEHWLPQHVCENLPSHGTPAGIDINHDNLIAVCLGYNANPYFNHCDKSRGKLNRSDQILEVKPQHFTYFFHTTFTYEAGRLVALNNNCVIQDDVDRKLNLNIDMIIHFRNVALDQFIKNLSGSKDEALLNHQLNRYNTPTSNGRLRKYCTFIVDSVHKKLA